MADHNNLSLRITATRFAWETYFQSCLFHPRRYPPMPDGIKNNFFKNDQRWLCLQKSQLATTWHESKRYHQLMNRCIVSENPAAHYIEGIKQYFIHDNTTIGMFHLKKSAKGSYDNGMYLYGILMLCTQNREERNMFLRSLGLEASKRQSDRFWRANKISLRYIIIIMKSIQQIWGKTNQYKNVTWTT